MPFNECIHAVKILVSFERREEAEVLLQRMASLVKPIMRKRGWTVQTLREFFPGNPMLLGLNVNRGKEIKIRLRPASNKKTFFPEHDLIGTLLHEYGFLLKKGVSHSTC